MTLSIRNVRSLVAIYSLFRTIVSTVSAKPVLLLLVVWAHRSVTIYSLRTAAEACQHRLLWCSSWSDGDFVFVGVWSCGFGHYV